MTKRFFRLLLAMSTILICFSISFGVLCATNVSSSASGEVSFNKGPATDIIGDITSSEGGKTDVVKIDENGDEVILQTLTFNLNQDGNTVVLTKVEDVSTSTQFNSVFTVPDYVNAVIDGVVAKLPVTKIADGAISFASWIDTLVIPATIEEIGANQFVYDDGTRNFIFLGEIPIISQFSIPSIDENNKINLYVKTEFYDGYVDRIENHDQDYWCWIYYSQLFETSEEKDDYGNEQSYLRKIEDNKILLKDYFDFIKRI